MADLLGEVDTNLPRRSAPRPVKTESRRKTRVLSPPISENNVNPTKKRPHDSDSYLPDTPPAQNAVVNVVDDDDDDGGYLPTMDDDAAMSDLVLPSSPITKAVERKSQTLVKIEEEEDDLLEVAQPTGHAGMSSASINISGKRPVAKIRKADYPTAASSSPVGPIAVDASAWNEVTSKLNVQSSPAPVTTNAGKLRPENALEEDGSLRMFWIDYAEINGSLCLFGKVRDKSTGSYVSCFAKVDNILRKLYFLPREHRVRRGQVTDEEVAMSDVYEEVDGVMSKHRVGMHKIKPCTRKYAFELPDIPKEADYLKLLYGYDKMPLAMDLTGETFSHVFGTNTSLSSNNSSCGKTSWVLAG
jgi:DNA polymerase alpha subunit A